MKITKIPPGASGYDNSIPKSLREQLDREPHDKEIHFVRDKIINVCNCQTNGNSCHNTLEENGVCKFCGYYTFTYNLTGREDKKFVEINLEEACIK